MNDVNTDKDRKYWCETHCTFKAGHGESGASKGCVHEHSVIQCDHAIESFEGAAIDGAQGQVSAGDSSSGGRTGFEGAAQQSGLLEIAQSQLAKGGVTEIDVAEVSVGEVHGGLTEQPHVDNSPEQRLHQAVGDGELLAVSTCGQPGVEVWPSGFVGNRLHGRQVVHNVFVADVAVPELHRDTHVHVLRSGGSVPAEVHCPGIFAAGGGDIAVFWHQTIFAVQSTTGGGVDKGHVPSHATLHPFLAIKVRMDPELTSRSHVATTCVQSLATKHSGAAIGVEYIQRPFGESG